MADLLAGIDPLEGMADPLEGKVDPLEDKADPLEGKADKADPLTKQNMDPILDTVHLIGKGEMRGMDNLIAVL